MHKILVLWIRKTGDQDERNIFAGVRWEHLLACLTRIVGKHLLAKASGGNPIGSKCMRQFAATVILKKVPNPHQAMRRIGGSETMAQRHYADRSSQAFQKLQEKRLIIGSTSSSSSSSSSGSSDTKSDGSLSSSDNADNRSRNRTDDEKKRRKAKEGKGQKAKSANPYRRSLEESESSDGDSDGKKRRKEGKGKGKGKGKSNRCVEESERTDSSDSGKHKRKKRKYESSTESSSEEESSVLATSSDSASPPPAESVPPAKVVTPSHPSSAVPDTGGGTSQPTEAEAEAWEALAEDVDVAAGGTTPPSDE